MLYRKIQSEIESHLKSDSSRMLIVDGARQVGKSYIIRHAGMRLFPNYIEVNMEEDKAGDRLFADVGRVDDFYMALSTFAGSRMGTREDTLVFIDEIQAYPHLFTLIKFLIADNRFTYIASGSLLGVTLQQTQSIPVGSMHRISMFPLDFEEFVIANGVGEDVIESMRQCFAETRELPQSLHDKMMDLFRKYLIVGGMPDCVNTFLSEHNVVSVRILQQDIRELYTRDAAKYEKENLRKLKIQRIYGMIPSNLENRKKRVVAKDVEGKRGKRMSDYQDEFDYLISAGIAIDVKAISQPTYPLVQNMGKNLLKLYLNDVGIFTGILYNTNISAIMRDNASVNLGAVYEAVVAQELRAHGFPLFYYDNKQNGEVDYLIDDHRSLSALPIEVKSGKDYRVHSALNRFISNPDYHVCRAITFSNERRVFTENGITYMPVYYVMFLSVMPPEGVSI